MKLYQAGLATLSLFVFARSTQAQPAVIQQIQQLQNNQFNASQQMPLPGLRPETNAPELYPGENVDVGPQEILRKNPRPKYFDLFVDSQVYYSDNATYGSVANRQGSFVYVNTAQATFTPPPLALGEGKLAPAVGFASQWYNYDAGQLMDLDFNAQTAFVGAKYTVGKWQATANFNYTRLLNLRDDDEGFQNYSGYHQTYQEFLPSLALQRIFILNDTMLLAIGDQVDYHFTDVPKDSGGISEIGSGGATEINDRFDEIIFATYNWQITKHFALQPFYRFQYSYYRWNLIQDSHRDEYLNAAGVAVIYTFNDWISARAFFNYNDMRTDDKNTPSYDEMNGGIGASLEVKF